MAQILRRGHSQSLVDARRLKYAEPLVEEGYLWRRLDEQHEAAVEALVRAHVNGQGAWSFGDADGGVVCLAPSGDVVAALVVSAMDVAGESVCLLRDLVVRPDERGRGIGFVTLAMIGQLVDLAKIGVVVGNCAADAARFHQRAGYTVLQPGELLHLGPERRPLQLGNESYPCWMVWGAAP